MLQINKADALGITFELLGWLFHGRPKKLLMQILRDEAFETGHHVPNASTVNSSTLDYSCMD